MSTQKKKAQPKAALTPEMVERDRITSGKWYAEVKPAPDGFYEIYSYYGERGYADDEKRVLVARCPTRNAACAIVSERHIAESATNWIDLIRKSMTQALIGKEAKSYRNAWRDYAKIEADECAFLKTPLEVWEAPE